MRTSRRSAPAFISPQHPVLALPLAQETKKKGCDEEDDEKRKEEEQPQARVSHTYSLM